MARFYSTVELMDGETRRDHDCYRMTHIVRDRVLYAIFAKCYEGPSWSVQESLC